LGEAKLTKPSGRWKNRPQETPPYWYGNSSASAGGKGDAPRTLKDSLKKEIHQREKKRVDGKSKEAVPFQGPTIKIDLLETTPLKAPDAGWIEDKCCEMPAATTKRRPNQTEDSVFRRGRSTPKKRDGHLSRQDRRGKT